MTFNAIDDPFIQQNVYQIYHWIMTCNANLHALSVENGNMEIMDILVLIIISGLFYPLNYEKRLLCLIMKVFMVLFFK